MRALRKEMILPNKNDINGILGHCEDMHKEMSNIHEKIRALKSEIDQRIYKLYGLSPG